jgi:hypothetical protein
MQPSTIHFPEPLLALIDDLARRETRTRSQQVVHLVGQALRSQGHRADDGPPIGVPLPTNHDELRAELGDIEAERDRLEAAQRRLGVRFMPHDETRLRYVRSRADALRQHVQVAERLNGGRNAG